MTIGFSVIASRCTFRRSNLLLCGIDWWAENSFNWKVDCFGWRKASTLAMRLGFSVIASRCPYRRSNLLLCGIGWWAENSFHRKEDCFVWKKTSTLAMTRKVMLLRAGVLSGEVIFFYVGYVGRQKTHFTVKTIASGGKGCSPSQKHFRLVLGRENSCQRFIKITQERSISF